MAKRWLQGVPPGLVFVAHSEATCFPKFCSVIDSRAWGYEREFKMVFTQWFAGIYLVAPFLRSSLELLDVSRIKLLSKTIQLPPTEAS